MLSQVHLPEVFAGDGGSASHVHVERGRNMGGRLGSRSPRKNKKDTIINRYYMTIYENLDSIFDISQMQKLILIKLIGRCLSSECLLKLCKLFGTLLICFISLDWYSWFVWDAGALCHILA